MRCAWHEELAARSCFFERNISLSRLYVVAFSRKGLELRACSRGTGIAMNRKTSHADCHRARRTVAPNGFTLMELLIVIAVILILMLMAMKTIGSMKIRANELSAINSIRVITSAETEYESTYGANGYACDLKVLGGVPGTGLPTPTSAQLLDNDLASSGYKSGYLFKISNCEKVTVNGTDRITGYVLTAVPASPGKTGNRGFCTDQFGGNPKYDPTGGANCTQSLQ